MLREGLVLAVLAVAAVAPAAGAHPQRSTALPDEFRPEGIAAGAGASFYVGSIPQGSVYRGSFLTGEGAVLVQPHPGRNHIGLKVDVRHKLLFVAGGASKGIYVYDARTGEDVASYSLPESGFVNDVVLTRKAAYFTDSRVPQLYRLKLGRHGPVGEPERIPISGDLVYAEGNNANGIEALHSGRILIVVQTNLGKLFAVHAASGRTEEIELDTPVTNGDGLLLRGRTLYVVQNRDDKIAVVDLERREVEGYLTSPLFDVPTTIAPFGPFIYAVNARFDRPDDSDDDIVRVRMGS
jgi:hypothetical protein